MSLNNRTMKPTAIVLLILIIIVEVASMTALTETGRDSNGWLLFGGIAGYLAIGGLFALIMASTEGKGLAFVNSVWNASTVILAAIVSVAIFDENLFWYQWIGISFAVAAVVLLGYGEYQQQSTTS